MGMITRQDPAIFGISGSKGGKGGGSEAPNTVRSNARVRLMEIISEGECVGLANGAQSIFFDYTPLKNADATYNFGATTPEQKALLETEEPVDKGSSGSTSGVQGIGINWSVRTGLPDQTHVPGIPTAETPFIVETRVKASTGPVVRTISEPTADSVRVIARVPGLVRQDKESGELKPTSVSWAWEVRSNGGAWNRVATETINNQKATSPFQVARRIELPVGGYPWQIRMVRITPDNDTVELQNETWWESYTTVVEGKFTYPHTAYIALEINAREFGTNIPARTYDWIGLKIQVPSNYDPITRTYTGIWDGTFKIEWTNNPAWIFYDLITHPRYGLGEYIDASKIDKWGLYQIAQYCDELIPSGYKNRDTGEDILEPRFTFNAWIRNREEAHKVLNNITAIFRGMAFWSLGQIFAVADMPKEPVKLVTPANTIDGRFKYSGTGLKSRHSVAVIKFSNQDDFGRPDTEIVPNEDLIKSPIGWREKEIDLFGCTSRGQAHRYAKWMLDSEQFETEVVEYRCSWDQADLLPGHIVAIADPSKAQARTGGRLKSVAGTVLELDKDFEPAIGESYQIMVTLPDGTLETKTIVAFTDGNTKVTIASALSQAVEPDAVYIIKGTDVAPRLFRVLSNKETEKNIFTISGLFYDPTKFARVEQGVILDPIRYARPRNIITAPTNLNVTESLFFQSGNARSRLNLSWTPPVDLIVKEYQISAQTPNGFVNYGAVTNPSFDVEDAKAGDWTFYVAAVSASGLTSSYTEIAFTAKGFEGLQQPYVSHLELAGRGNETTFGGKEIKVVWRNNFPDVSSDLGEEENGASANDINPFFRDNVIRIFHPTTNELLRQQVCDTREFLYTFEMNTEDNARFNRGPLRSVRLEVTIRDTLGRESSPAVLTVSNPVPELFVPNVRPGIEQVFVELPPTTDLDVMGYTVWMESNNAFNPKTTQPVYDGTNNILTLKATANQTYFIRAAAYDAFGRDGMNICPPIPVTVEAGIDTEPPEVPTGLVLTPLVETNASGSVQTKLVAIWDASTSENFGVFEVAIRPAGGSWINYTTSTPRFEWLGLTMNADFEVRVRALNKFGYPSAYSATATVTMPENETAPGAPHTLSIVASLRSAFLKWINPVDPDLDVIEIWSHSADVRGSATLVGTSKGTSFTHTGLTTGQQRFYWIRARNTSGVIGPWNATAGVAVTPGQVQEGDIAANSIIGDHIQANTIAGNRLIVDTQLPPTILVGTTGVEIGDLTDPAALVNAQTTLIEPGKITISGVTTLASWRHGSDLTKIAGGSIAANSIAANTLEIGLRGLDIQGLEFSFNKTTNVLSWSTGVINWISDAGLQQTTVISAGNVTWTAGVIFVAWQKGATTLTTTTAISAVTGADWVRLATYRGGLDLVANYGRTLVDGEHIITGTILASKLNVASLSAIAANLGTITAGKAQSTNGRFVVDFDNERLDSFDESGNLIMRIGKLS